MIREFGDGCTYYPLVGRFVARTVEVSESVFLDFDETGALVGIEDLDEVITVHFDEDTGSYWAEVRGMPGCFATADQIHGLVEALGDAIQVWAAKQPEERS